MNSLKNILAASFLVTLLLFVFINAYIPNGQTQADWSQVGSGAVDFIKNKPNTLPWDTAYNYRCKFYDASGIMNRSIKIWNSTVTPSTASGGTIDISSAGFTQILSIQIQTVKNTATATAVPAVSVKSFTTTQIVTNITNGNTNALALLVSTLFPADVTGIQLQILVIGY